MMADPERVSILTLHCREATQLISAAVDRELTSRERWALRIHLWICGSCRRFTAQIAFLRQVIQARPHPWRQLWLNQAQHLPEARRQEIKQLLARAGEGK